MKIALMCPTRNRMNKLMTLVSSLITTVKNPNNVKLILGVDADDPAFKYYEYLQQNTSFIELVVFQNHGKFLGLSTMWNTMAVQKDNFDIYAMIGDDMIFSTQNWDEEITHDFNNGPSDKILLVHCNDGMRGPGNKYENVPPLCVNFFIHKNYIKTTGYFVEPYMPNTHHDTWPQIVFNSLGRVKYRHDILIKHLHYSETTNKMDNVSSNLEKLRENIWDNNDWVKTYSKEINEEIIKLREFMAIENR